MAPKQRELRVVEVVGPAGAGKSSLCRMLSGYPERIRIEYHLDVHRLQDLLLLSVYQFRLLPRLMRLYRGHGRWLTHQEYTWLTMLMAWPGRLRRNRRADDKIVILDQGPIYLLAEQKIFGPDWLRILSSSSTWQKMYHNWATTLDLLVWLDTDNDRLMQRINSRNEDHAVKNKPAEKVHEFLNMYRTAYNDVFRRFRADPNCPRTVSFDTGQESLEGIKRKLLTELNVQDGRRTKEAGKGTLLPLRGRPSPS
jgi:deoxyadenosine/deoxycytidine kinase